MYQKNRLYMTLGRIILCLITLVLTSHTNVFAQKTKFEGIYENYILTDSSSHTGIPLQTGTEQENARFIIATVKGEKMKLGPDQIVEYGFKNGQVYQSHSVTLEGKEQKVFLELLTSGKYRLYYISAADSDYYFVQYQDSWYKLDEEDFRDKLRQIKECDKIDSEIQLVAFQKKAMTKLIGLFNKCKTIPFPHINYGLMVGMVFSDANSSNTDELQFRDGSFATNTSFRAGAWISLPVEMTFFSFRSGLNFQFNSFEFQQPSGVNDLDVVINMMSIEVPLFFTYTLPTFHIRPYVFAGTSFTHNIYYDQQVQDQLFPDFRYDRNFISGSMYGLHIGGGILYQLNPGKSLKLELEYNRKNGAANTMSIENIGVSIAYSL